MANRVWLERIALPDAAREQVTVALAMIDALDAQAAPITAELRRHARRQPGCRALMGLYGVGELTAVAILAELGDTRRFSSSRQAVRYAGLDVTVHQSDQRRAPGHLSRQGPPALRWALYEAAQAARRPGSPDRAYYDQAAQRLGGNRACLALARKLLKRKLHTLREPRRPSHRAGLSTAVGARAALPHTDAPRPAPRMLLLRPQGGWPTKTERPHRITTREHPINHHVTDPGTQGRGPKISPGARTHHTRPDHRAHDPPPQPRPLPTLTPRTGTEGSRFVADSRSPLGSAWLTSVRSRHVRDRGFNCGCGHDE